MASDRLWAVELYEPFGRGELSVDVRSVEAHDEVRDRRFPIEVWYPVAEPAGDALVRPGVLPIMVLSQHSFESRRDVGVTQRVRSDARGESDAASEQGTRSALRRGGRGEGMSIDVTAG